MYTKVKQYFSLVRFSHTIFALPFAVLGFFLAVSTSEEPFSWKKFSLMLLCMVFARNAAMAFNRYLDRHLDAKNPRTQLRPIPQGQVSAQAAILVVIVNSILFLITTWFLTPLCFYLAPIALLVILGYSFTKHFTALSHIILGLGISLAPIGAYLVVSTRIVLIPILFSFAVLFWVSGFDIIYALQDEPFDKAEQLHSIPVLLGKQNAVCLSRCLHALSVVSILLPIFFVSFTWLYYLGALFFSIMLIYQHRLVKLDNLIPINRSFTTVNGATSLLFVLFFLLDRLWVHA